MNLDTVSFTVTAPGATGTLMTAVSGDPANVRNGTPGSRILGISMWTLAQGVGFTQVLWPSGHDLVRNYRYRNAVSRPAPMVTQHFPAQFRAQDPITATQAGSVTAGDVELLSMLMFYEDLPGVSGRLITIETLRTRGVSIVTYEDSITPTAASIYSGGRTIGQAANTFKANTDYALLGAYVPVNTNNGALTVRGVDSGNLRVGIPPLVSTEQISQNWFAYLAEMLDLPLIPVFNSANFAGTFCELLSNENLTATPFNLVMAELAPSRKVANAVAAAQVASAPLPMPAVSA